MSTTATRRRTRAQRWSLLVIPLLAGAAITTVLASPAAADIPGRETVSSSSPNDSNDKQVTVTCPDDQWVYGSGVDVGGDGKRYVIVDELIPTLHSVSAYAYEYEYGTSDTWTVRVWAVCGDPRGTHRTSSRESTWDSNNKDASVTCQAGTVVTGTGWQIEGARGQVLVESVIPTSDTVTVSAYEVDAGGSGQYFDNWSVRAFATCVTAPAGREIVNTLGTSNSVDKNGSATCLNGKESTGGGFYLSGPRGRINNINLIPTRPAVQTYATEVVSTINNWPIRSYAICVTP